MLVSVIVQVREYILQLEAHLSEAHKQATRLIKRQSELGASLGEFGSSLMGLGKFEQAPLADSFINMGEKSSALAQKSQVRPTLERQIWQKLRRVAMDMEGAPARRVHDCQNKDRGLSWRSCCRSKQNSWRTALRPP